MWVFSIYGFYSIACATETDGNPGSRHGHGAFKVQGPPSKPAEAVSRARGFKTLSPPNRDYGYRLIVPKSVWVRALQEIAEEQTWDNFKNEVAQRMGREVVEYTNALHEVWGMMYRLQESETRQGSL